MLYFQPLFMDIGKTGVCRNFEFINASCEKYASKKEIRSCMQKSQTVGLSEMCMCQMQACLATSRFLLAEGFPSLHTN